MPTIYKQLTRHIMSMLKENTNLILLITIQLIQFFSFDNIFEDKFYGIILLFFKHK